MEKEFRNCYTEDCYDCPNYEDCQGNPPDDMDDRDRELEELWENEDFAQDGDFHNMDYDLDDYGDY